MKHFSTGKACTASIHVKRVCLIWVLYLSCEKRVFFASRTLICWTRVWNKIRIMYDFTRLSSHICALPNPRYHSSGSITVSLSYYPLYTSSSFPFRPFLTSIFSFFFSLSFPTHLSSPLSNANSQAHFHRNKDNTILFVPKCNESSQINWIFNELQ